jgi:hypothetical protein
MNSDLLRQRVQERNLNELLRAAVQCLPPAVPGQVAYTLIAMTMWSNMLAKKELHRLTGGTEYRGHQEEAIDAVLQGAAPLPLPAGCGKYTCRDVISYRTRPRAAD